MRFERILLPVDLIHTPAGDRLWQQAAYLVHHFTAEIIVLHVLTPLRYPGGVLEAGHALTKADLQVEVVERAQAQLEEFIRIHLPGRPVRRVLARGEVAPEIVRTANAEGAELIMMSTHPRSGLRDALFGVAANRVLHRSDCPLWTDSGASDRVGEFALRRVLCAVDLGGHSRRTLARAAELAAEFSAALTLVHVIAGTTIFAPGGEQELTEMKRELMSGASAELAELQREVGTQAEVVIESGAVLPALNAAVQRTGSDLLVIGRLPAWDRVGGNGSGFSIMRDTPIPVISL